MSLVRAFGFYPDGHRKGVIGPVPGTVMDEARKGGLSRGGAALIVRVTPEDYRKAEAVRRRWEARTYRLTESDCISFTQGVATALGLKSPSRGRGEWPVDFIRRLAEAN